VDLRQTGTYKAVDACGKEEVVVVFESDALETLADGSTLKLPPVHVVQSTAMAVVRLDPEGTLEELATGRRLQRL
jgi:hypothetical protein